MRPYPLKFNDIFKEKIWGGDALGRLLGKAVGRGSRVGESWELSEHKNGSSVICNGELAGTPLSEAVKRHPDALLGARIAKSFGIVPLLYKFIDANDKLSIQVHPGDAYARAHENDFGKTEAWYVVHAEPGARMICGLKKRLTQAEVEHGVTSGTLESLLNEFPVRTGDTVFVPAGTVHAIETGTVIYEVQQVSDVTYRLYDWNRLGDDGKPRDLHVAQSLKVMNYGDTADHRTRPAALRGSGFTREALCGCGYFVLERYVVETELPLDTREAFAVITVLGGRGMLRYPDGECEVRGGETVCLPAALGACRIFVSGGPLTLLLSRVPESTEAYVKELLSNGAAKSDIKALGGLI